MMLMTARCRLYSHNNATETPVCSRTEVQLTQFSSNIHFTDLPMTFHQFPRFLLPAFNSRIFPRFLEQWSPCSIGWYSSSSRKPRTPRLSSEYTTKSVTSSYFPSCRSSPFFGQNGQLGDRGTLHK